MLTAITTQAAPSTSARVLIRLAGSRGLMLFRMASGLRQSLSPSCCAKGRLLRHLKAAPLRKRMSRSMACHGRVLCASLLIVTLSPCALPILRFQRSSGCLGGANCLRHCTSAAAHGAVGWNCCAADGLDGDVPPAFAQQDITWESICACWLDVQLSWETKLGSKGG